MGGTPKVMDGSCIKGLVEDPTAFSRYVDEKFNTLDKAHDGKLSKEELLPVSVAIGSALGLPAKGSSPETDHIYDELLGEFLKKDSGGTTKEEFASVLRDMLLGVADGLERDPVVLHTLSGSGLEEYVKSSSFEVDAVAVFSELEKGSGGKIPSSAIAQAIQKISVDRGMPPSSDTHIAKEIVEPALRSAGVDSSKELNQDEFLASYRQSLLAIASQMKSKPVTVAHTEKVFDGSTISTFLKDKSVVQQTLDDIWVSLDSAKLKDKQLPKSNFRLGLDLIAPFAGLPPLGAVEEMDHVVDDSFNLVDVEKGGEVGKDEFCKSMLEILGGIMLQLKGKPIAVSMSVPASDADPEDCLKL